MNNILRQQNTTTFSNNNLLPTSLRTSAVAAVSTPVYDKDVHYHLTTALALAAGFSDADAAMIAGNNQYVDDNPKTTPMPLGWMDEVFLDGKERRELWHFTTDERLAEVKKEFERTGSLEDLGKYMHVLQDKFSHEGLGPVFGQIGTRVDIDGKTRRDATKPSAWHEADDPSQNPQKALDMARKSFNELVAAKDLLERNGKLRKSYPTMWNDNMGKLLDKFVREPNQEKRKEIATQIGAMAFRFHVQVDNPSRR